MAWDTLQVQVATGKDKIDPVLIRTSNDLLECAAKEMGEWRPDRGEQSEATTKLAQSIVVTVQPPIAGVAKEKAERHDGG